MDDVRPLQRTVRRSAAIVIAVGGLLVAAAAPSARNTGLVVLSIATVYLAASLVWSPEWELDAGSQSERDGDGERDRPTGDTDPSG